MLRKDIENMEIILLAIRRVEAERNNDSLEAAQRLDTLYSSLRIAAWSVVENQKLDELDTTNRRVS